MQLTKIEVALEGFERRLARIEDVQKEIVEKWAVAGIVGQMVKWLARMLWYAAVAITGYVVVHWVKIKQFVEGKLG